ncbi:unnamed protein product, partial [Mesorhabditis spiculigera]
MFLDYFNCGDCHKPFHRELNMPHTPVHSPVTGRVACSSCMKDPRKVPLLGLIKFLNQRAFHRAEQTYTCQGTLNGPQCIKCNTVMVPNSDWKAYIVTCGHYFCEDCFAACVVGHRCSACDAPVDKERSRLDKSLAAFFNYYDEELQREIRDAAKRLEALNNQKRLDEAREKQLDVLSKRYDQAEKLKEVDWLQDNEFKRDAERRGLFKSCCHCTARKLVENLLFCLDCTKIACPLCFSRIHLNHAVGSLVVMKADELRLVANKKYKEDVSGLRAKLAQLHKDLDEVLEKVVKAGTGRLTKAAQSEKLADAQNIVSDVESTADRLKAHCEKYLPMLHELIDKAGKIETELSK